MTRELFWVDLSVVYEKWCKVHDMLVVEGWQCPEATWLGLPSGHVRADCVVITRQVTA